MPEKKKGEGKKASLLCYVRGGGDREENDKIREQVLVASVRIVI